MEQQDQQQQQQQHIIPNIRLRLIVEQGFRLSFDISYVLQTYLFILKTKHLNTINEYFILPSKFSGEHEH